MSAPAFKINDRRSSSGYVNKYWNGSTNALFDGLQSNTERKAPPQVDRDTHINLSEVGYRGSIDIGRYISSNYGPVRGAILEQATLSVGGNFIAQYEGPNKAWGAKAEEMLWNWHKICDMRGPPYDFETDLFLSLVSIKRDGDSIILLTQTEAEYPMIQIIPNHRVGSRRGELFVGPGGAYDGARICNGVILDDYARPQAFRLCDDQGNFQRDEMANNVIQSYSPDFTDQCRGITPLLYTANDWRDVKEIREFYRLALKAEAAIAYEEHNETGAPSGLRRLSEAVALSVDGSSRAADKFEKLEGGAIRYFRAGGNTKITALNSDRPARNTQEFTHDIMRGAFQALEWPMEFTYLPGLGGADTRMVVAKVRYTVEKNQELLKKIARRIDGWAIKKFVHLGLLEDEPTWWMWTHQTPRHITVDAGRDFKALVEQYKMGFITLKDVFGQQGKWWEEEEAQRLAEAKLFVQNVKELASSEGITFEQASDILRQRYPNQAAAAPQAAQPTDTEEKEAA